MSLDSSSPTKAAFSIDHLSVFDPLHIVLNSALAYPGLSDFFPVRCHCIWVLLAVDEVQPQGKCVQCLDKTNTGVTVVARRVSIKLSISQREGSETLRCAGPPCGSVKAESFRPIPGKRFPLCQAFSPKHAASAPFSRPLSYLRARSSAPELASLVWGYQDPLGGQPLDCTGFEGSFLSAWSVLAASSSFRQESTVHHMRSLPESRQASGNLYLVLQMSFVISSPSPLLSHAGHTGTTCLSPLALSWRREQKPVLSTLFSVLVVMPSPSLP